MGALLLLALLALAARQAAAAHLPDSYVLLPITAFTNNISTLIAAYTCNPIYASTPCSGHGSCHLLLDSTANISQPFIQAATVQPVFVSQSSLDTSGMNGATTVPAAVCVCDSGWTGRGDFINHYALDGDSCHVQQSIVTGLCVVGVGQISFLVFLALYRLLRWYAWHTACLSAPSSVQVVAVDTLLSDRPSRSSDVVDVHKASDTTGRAAQRPTVSVNDTSTASQASPSTPTTVSSTAHQTPATLPLSPPNLSTRLSPNPKARITLPAPPVVYTTAAQRRALWLRNLQHITFVHPFCSLIVGCCILAYFVLRLTSTLTIGHSYTMSVLIYVQHQPFCVAISIGTANNLKMAATFTRTATGATGLSTVIRAAKRYLLWLCVYGFFGWLLLWFMPAFPDSQQTLAVLVLIFCFLPDLLIGPISVWATRRVTAALVRHLDILSAEQQAERRTASKKLRSFSYMITGLVAANGMFCLLFACSAVLRQSGLPLFTLVWHMTIFLVLVFRLLLLRSPVRTGAGAAAVVHPASPVAAGAVAGTRAAGGSSRGRFIGPRTDSGSTGSVDSETAINKTAVPLSARSTVGGGSAEVGPGRSVSAAVAAVLMMANKRDSESGVRMDSVVG